MYVLKAKLALPTHSGFIVAIATIYWSTFTGLERYFGVFATLGAHCGECLPLGPVAVATIAVTLCLSCLAAWETSLRLINIALRREELLLLSTEGEGSPTIGTLDRLVQKTHRMTSSLCK